MLPVCQTLLYFTEDDVNEARDPEKGKIVFLRSCDLAAVQRFDYIFLQLSLIHISAPTRPY